MNGITLDSSGAIDDKKTNMVYRAQQLLRSGAIWLDFYELGDTNACASFYMDLADLKGMIAYLQETVNALERYQIRQMITEEDINEFKKKLTGGRPIYRAEDKHVDDY